MIVSNDQKIKSMTLDAKVIRADGRVENLGTIAKYKRPRIDTVRAFLRKLTRG